MTIRAQAIFDSAMQRTSMKWGKATKLAGGAALVFAMREQGRGDRTHHVAVSPSSLFLSSVTSIKTTFSTPFVSPYSRYGLLAMFLPFFVGMACATCLFRECYAFLLRSLLPFLFI